MPDLSGLALTTQQTVEILSLYSSSQFAIDAVAEEPGWTIVGGFPMDLTADIRLDVMGAVSTTGLTMTCRMYGVSPGFVGEVSGSRVALTSIADVRVLSGRFTLEGGRLYQVQAQVVGDAGPEYFGVVRRAAPAGV